MYKGRRRLLSSCAEGTIHFRFTQMGGILTLNCYMPLNSDIFGLTIIVKYELNSYKNYVLNYNTSLVLKKCGLIVLGMPPNL